MLENVLVKRLDRRTTETLRAIWQGVGDVQIFRGLAREIFDGVAAKKTGSHHGQTFELSGFSPAARRPLELTSTIHLPAVVAETTRHLIAQRSKDFRSLDELFDPAIATPREYARQQPRHVQRAAMVLYGWDHRANMPVIDVPHVDARELAAAFVWDVIDDTARQMLVRIWYEANIE